MAKVYSTPEDFDVPALSDFSRARGDSILDRLDAYDKACDKYRAKLAAYCRQMNPDNALVGKVLHLGPVGDGYAEYMVWNTKPLSLIHLPIGDAWQMPAAYERGLTLAEVKRMVR